MCLLQEGHCGTEGVKTGSLSHCYVLFGWGNSESAAGEHRPDPKVTRVCSTVSVSPHRPKKYIRRPFSAGVGVYRS